MKNKEEGPYYVFVSRKKTESKNKSLVGHHLSFDIPVHHECQVFGEGDESTNSKNFWSECRKNPGHPKFMSVLDFREHYLPKVQTDKQRKRLNAMIDLTAKVRVTWTSPCRPDKYPFDECRE